MPEDNLEIEEFFPSTPDQAIINQIRRLDLNNVILGVGERQVVMPPPQSEWPEEEAGGELVEEPPDFQIDVDGQNLEDLRQKYEGVYVTLNNGELFLINRFFAERQGEVKVTGFTEEGYKENEFDPKDTTVINFTDILDFDILLYGIVNTDVDVAYCYRIPRRQWKRGLFLDNFIINRPHRALIAASKYLCIKHTSERVESKMWRTSDFTPNNYSFFSNFTNIKKLVQNVGKYFSLKEIMNLLYNGERLAGAINDEYFVTPNTTKEFDFILWRRNRPVAVFNKDGYYVSSTEAYSEEAHDILKSLKEE